MDRFAPIVSDSIFTNSHFLHASVNAGVIQTKPMDQNPFQPPAFVEHDNPLRKLRVPAYLMASIATLSLLNAIVFYGVQFYRGEMHYDLSEAKEFGRLAALFVIPLVHFAYLYASYSMLSGRNHETTKTIMIVGCVPLCSPFIFLGIPIAIWALVILLRKDVKAAFST